MNLPVKLVSLLLLSATPATAAAQTEISGVAGYGHVGGEDVSGHAVPLLGVSANGRLGGPELKVDYEFINWERDGVGGLHLIGFGWLIQPRRPGIRPFFQLGWTLGVDARPPNLAVVNRFQGPALSTGVSFPLREQFFLRPELRWRMIAPGPEMLVLPSLSVGWRF